MRTLILLSAFFALAYSGYPHAKTQSTVNVNQIDPISLVDNGDGTKTVRFYWQTTNANTNFWSPYQEPMPPGVVLSKTLESQGTANNYLGSFQVSSKYNLEVVFAGQDSDFCYRAPFGLRWRIIGGFSAHNEEGLISFRTQRRLVGSNDNGTPIYDYWAETCNPDSLVVNPEIQPKYERGFYLEFENAFNEVYASYEEGLPAGELLRWTNGFKGIYACIKEGKLIWNRNDDLPNNSLPAGLPDFFESEFTSPLSPIPDENRLIIELTASTDCAAF